MVSRNPPRETMYAESRRLREGTYTTFSLCFYSAFRKEIIFPYIFIMYYYHPIFLIANLLVLVASSDNLFSLDSSEDSLYDLISILKPDGSTTAQQLTIDDLNSGLELMDFDDSVDLFSFEDDAPFLLANNVPQSHCNAAADASDFTLEARDGGQSCTTQQNRRSSPILSPETLQLFQDPTTGLNNLVSPSKQKNQGPSGSGEPPNPVNQPLYPGYLPDDNPHIKTAEELKWDLEDIGVGSRENDFYCLHGYYKVPVCCDGPVRYLGDISECDACKISWPKTKTKKNIHTSVDCSIDSSVLMLSLTYVYLS